MSSGPDRYSLAPGGRCSGPVGSGTEAPVVCLAVPRGERGVWALLDCYTCWANYAAVPQIPQKVEEKNAPFFMPLVQSMPAIDVGNRRPRPCFLRDTARPTQEGQTTALKPNILGSLFVTPAAPTVPLRIWRSHGSQTASLRRFEFWDSLIDKLAEEPSCAVRWFRQTTRNQAWKTSARLAFQLRRDFADGLDLLQACLHKGLLLKLHLSAPYRAQQSLPK